MPRSYNERNSRMNTGNANRSTGVVARLLAAGFAVLLLAVALFSFSAGSSHASVLRHKPPPTPTPSPTHTPSPTVTPSPSPPPGPWKLTGSMHSNRAGHTATLLQSGQVLVTGGYTDFYASVALASAELYTPATGTWTTTGSMSSSRAAHTATLLQSGQVLVAGGNTTGAGVEVILASAELYNPATGTWTTTGSMTTPRLNQMATLLPNSQVLVAGGIDTGDIPIASAELFTP